MFDEKLIFSACSTLLDVIPIDANASKYSKLLVTCLENDVDNRWISRSINSPKKACYTNQDTMCIDQCAALAFPSTWCTGSWRCRQCTAVMRLRYFSIAIASHSRVVNCNDLQGNTVEAQNTYRGELYFILYLKKTYTMLHVIHHDSSRWLKSRSIFGGIQPHSLRDMFKNLPRYVFEAML